MNRPDNPAFSSPPPQINQLQPPQPPPISSENSTAFILPTSPSRCALPPLSYAKATACLFFHHPCLPALCPSRALAVQATDNSPTTLPTHAPAAAQPGHPAAAAAPPPSNNGRPDCGRRGTGAGRRQAHAGVPLAAWHTRVPVSAAWQKSSGRGHVQACRPATCKPALTLHCKHTRRTGCRTPPWHSPRRQWRS